ncbi:MAG TPA: phosphatidylserine/phosphatidylglycerophosphate/cardiolipin synthase family protein [Gemmataceae bacterium]|jgi:cardiolipin synthase|nr:phosphatidylserine/phosphatidylglycerophosphate/cardiolipin synthase family protein [Gemmataceae bacterium]
MNLHTPGSDAVPSPVAALDPSQPRRVVVADQELIVFAESPPLIEAMLADIRAARRRIWVETYIFFNDSAGEAVAEALKERARDGLDVRLLYDALGSSATPSSFFRRLENAGVQVHAFHSLWEALWRLAFFRILNRRDHRKLLIVDDRIGYFGGMNLANPGYIPGSAPGRRRRRSTGWRDIHIRLNGPRQAELAESFELSWRRARHLPLPARPGSRPQVHLADDVEGIQFFDCGSGRRRLRAAQVFSAVLRKTRRSLMLSMAYFLPFGRVLRELLKAHRRGVFIRVVVPGASDVPLVQSATRHLYFQLLRKRFHIFERQRNMLHSKVLVADQERSIVGSCNLDARSLRINLEFLAVIRSRPLAAVLADIIRYEVVHSRRITMTECVQRSGWRRLLDRLAWALRWWL